ncbi:MAG: hypothetical protein E7638_06965 [Ruminococcaceae bacterium]|nr:hypothetical protein [Oscillospiraceae bacterium]
MKKKLTSLLLAMLMLTSTVACSNPGSGDETETTRETIAPVDTSNIDMDSLTDYERRQLISDELPVDTYGGRSFRVMTYDTKYGDASYEILSEDINGDGCNDAIYNRNLDIEKRFDVKIQCQTDPEPHITINNLVTAGTDDYDLIGMYNFIVYSPINVNSAYNWLEVPYVNQEKPWHNSLANGNATLNNRLYSMCSDLAVSSMTYTYAIFFNIGLATNNGWSSRDLYTLVDDGEWTIDKLIEITTNMYENVNGNDVRDAEDVYGFGYYISNPADVWLAAFNQPICRINEGKEIEVTFMGEKTISILEKLLDYQENNPGFRKLTAASNVQYDEEKLFVDKKLVMAPLRFYAAYNTLPSMDAEYSILPFPKWDTTQDKYYTNADDKFTAFVIPTTAYKQVDFIGVIYEALCAETYKTVYPEYYDGALKGRYSAEPETAEMIDLIMTGRNFDFSFQFGQSYFLNLPYLMRDMLMNNNSSLNSEYKKISKKLGKNIENEIYPLYGIEID